jgi:hypothetical protein
MTLCRHRISLRRIEATSTLRRPFRRARAYPEWTGGALGVLSKQMEDFSDVHDKWYLDDLQPDQ